MFEKPYILYADDDVPSQLAIKKLLQDNFEVKFINNFGRDCLELLDERLPDLIILGSYMYLYNKLDTHDFLRSKDKYQNIPIISTYTKIAETENDTYLAMPLDKDRLFLSINKLLNHQLEVIN
ncbi:MAG: hypothetical protein KZQ83_17935 [gamma proteobacterium symbiont of Taylorina sp.]|nr:hypothetical protein [gamma proteobacterium symbiont of Taylorina sp.]